MSCENVLGAKEPRTVGSACSELGTQQPLARQALPFMHLCGGILFPSDEYSFPTRVASKRTHVWIDSKEEKVGGVIRTGIN